MSRFNSPVRRALILSGGGGRGAYQVGVWRRLQELTTDHILASCSIPVLFPWVAIGGEYYWDGGDHGFLVIFRLYVTGNGESSLLSPQLIHQALEFVNRSGSQGDSETGSHGTTSSFPASST